jgi:aspartate 1-decarboxylase
MFKTYIKSKIHRATVTDANLDYVGSITIDQELMEAVGLEPFELVHVNNLSNAAHWETYIIPGTNGQIVLNGPPSRLFQKGDLVVILGMTLLSPGDTTVHKTVFVDKNNKATNILETKIECKYN